MFTSIVIILSVLVSIRLLCELIRRLRRKPFLWFNEGGKSWAIVTGAGNGMGYEWARQLALKGYNLLLISLLEQELREAKERILSEVKHSSGEAQIEIRILAIDFSRLDIYEQVETFLDLKQNNVFVLVNNVGTAMGLPTYFLDGDYPLRNRTIRNVNLESTTRMIELVLPSMLHQKRGLVINMGSASCLLPAPLFNVYTATKAYILNLTESLAEEYYDKNITFCAFSPFWVSTGMTKSPKTSWFILSAREYIEMAMSSIKYHEYDHSYDSVFYLPFYLQYIFPKMIGWLFTRQLMGRFQLWFITRCKKLGERLRYWQERGRPVSQWRQLKYFLLLNEKDA